MGDQNKLADSLLQKIKANQPEEILKTDKDCQSTIVKGNIIKNFLYSLLYRPIKRDTKDQIISDIQMIALYGEWGSGKTSLMKYIQSQLDAGNSFKTVFFPAWEMEKDNNLALSLLESIIGSENTINTTNIKTALLAIGRGLSVNIGPVKINCKDIIQSVENYKTRITDESSFIKINNFKNQYCDLEKNILEKVNRRKLLVFIDDLDRCEPENVLDLLSAIKLFFTFSNRTIFICGLDEKAVDEAVKVKYGNVIKAGEYMEKIFDISFDIPTPDINKIIKSYFEDMPEAIINIQNFFKEMHFTNPRHIKKILNKYLLLRYYQESKLDQDGLIPKQNRFFFLCLTLFIIMLYKFEPKNFEMLRNYDQKLQHMKYSTDQGELLDYFDNLSTINVYKYPSGSLKAIHQYGLDKSTGLKNDEFLIKIITLFAPYIVQMNLIDMHTFSQLKEKKKKYIEQFSNDETIGLPAFFCHYISLHSNILDNLIKDSDYRLWNIFDMAERYL